MCTNSHLVKKKNTQSRRSAVFGSEWDSRLCKQKKKKNNACRNKEKAKSWNLTKAFIKNKPSKSTFKTIIVSMWVCYVSFAFSFRLTHINLTVSEYCWRIKQTDGVDFYHKKQKWCHIWNHVFANPVFMHHIEIHISMSVVCSVSLFHE